ncbi:MAG: UDP-glucose/GDP-mannose dehydrogenase family protein [Pseudomonadales bacterium]|jgi:UDPglucose 6-dehydrogenase|nr:UDP-glucose/GDP-mannose dehydrogenase family protein [Pseudomonadales bacterium]
MEKNNMKIVVVGTGFVGVTSSVVYASFGNDVVGLDIDETKIKSLEHGKVPFYEPKLTEMLKETVASGKLTFTTSYEKALKGAQIVIIAVGTPSREDGSIDLSYIEKSAEAMAPYLEENTIITIKSTVLPGTLKIVQKIIEKSNKKTLHYASLPEFLKEGTAVDDTLYPDRIVIGATNKLAKEKLIELHKPLKAPIVIVSPESAQLSKYASNDYLAIRIAYANEIANLCEKSGANVEEVLHVMGLEKRIGDHYWYPGFGYGGSCFPKDVKALAAFSEELGFDDNLFRKIDKLNSLRPVYLMENFIKKIGNISGKKIAVLGLSFKPNTDDQRESPALAIIPYLLEKGAEVISYDPMVKKIDSKEIVKNKNYKQVESIDEAIAKADIIIALVEWPQIVGYKFIKNKSVANEYFIDARNQFDGKQLKEAGFKYLAIGK